MCHVLNRGAAECRRASFGDQEDRRRSGRGLSDGRHARDGETGQGQPRDRSDPRGRAGSGGSKSRRSGTSIRALYAGVSRLRGRFRGRFWGLSRGDRPTGPAGPGVAAQSRHGRGHPFPCTARGDAFVQGSERSGRSGRRRRARARRPAAEVRVSTTSLNKSLNHKPGCTDTPRRHPGARSTASGSSRRRPKARDVAPRAVRFM